MTSTARIAGIALDGTIPRRAPLGPFVARVLVRRPLRMLRLWPLPWALLRYAVRRDRGALKESLLRHALGGLTRGELAVHVADYLDRLWRRGLRPGALAAIERHRAAGDRLVLLSASPDLYVPAIGARLRFDEVICTELQWRGERLGGRLATANRRGAEKRRCIEALKERHPLARLSAYGNAASDLEHLAIVDAPRLVNANAAARRRAAALGIPCDDWP
jgi:phosphatidylglycerophosphatase C